MVKKKKPKKPVVFFDFDNTVTEFDVLDSVIERYSVDPAWEELERLWKAGRIGSAECLDGQLRGIRATKRSLDRYLSTIRIDPYYKKILRLLRRKKIKTFILSDSFDYILKKILKNNDCRAPKMLSNKLKIRGARLLPVFPLTNKKCLKCAHCKSRSLELNSGPHSAIFYIGDGLSDLCASKRADIIFAKGTLKDRLRNDGIKHIPFRDLKKVYNGLRRVLS